MGAGLFERQAITGLEEGGGTKNTDENLNGALSGFVQPGCHKVMPSLGSAILVHSF
jgi:hypothetical protein